MIEFLVIAFITGVKAIFSASDTAFVYLNKAEINQLSKKDKKAQKIKYLMEESSKFFGVVEMGTNFAELVASSYASVTILNSLSFEFEMLNIPSNISIFIASFIITIILAYILLIFGGILPKRIARSKPKDTAFKLVNIVWIMTKINYPFEKIVNKSMVILSKILKLPNDKQEKLTDKQIRMIITEGREEGVIASIEKKILLNTLKLNDITVKKIMTPREKVNFINADDKFVEVLNNLEIYHYTRIPFYQGDIDNIIGILNIKDIVLEYAKNRKINRDVKYYLRKPKFIAPEEKIFDAFKKMQKENQMIAIVRDRDSKILGVVTLEDIIEKVVGKISDEYDIEAPKKEGE